MSETVNVGETVTLTVEFVTDSGEYLQMDTISAKIYDASRNLIDTGTPDETISGNKYTYTYKYTISSSLNLTDYIEYYYEFIGVKDTSTYSEVDMFEIEPNNDLIVYTTVGEVRSYLQKTVGSTTKPSSNDTRRAIRRAQDRIEAITHHAWRSKSSDLEYHDMPRWSVDNWATRSINLRHRDISTFTTLEYFDGQQWVNCLTDWTEDRSDGDYWVDYETGILYIHGRYGVWINISKFRVQYTYGSVLNGNVRELCTLMVAQKLMLSDDYSNLFPVGSNSIDLGKKIELIELEIKEILGTLVEVTIY